MLPPGIIYYYFTVGDEKVYINEKDKKLAAERNIEHGYELLKLNVKKTNVIENLIQNNNSITKKYIDELRHVVRPKATKLRGRKKVKQRW